MVATKHKPNEQHGRRPPRGWSRGVALTLSMGFATSLWMSANVALASTTPTVPPDTVPMSATVGGSGTTAIPMAGEHGVAATSSASVTIAKPRATDVESADAVSSTQVPERTLTVAVPDSYLMSFDGGTLDAQIEQMNAALKATHSGYHLVVQAFQASDATSQLSLIKPDFVLAQSSLIIAVAGKEGTPAYTVATRKVAEAKEAAHSVGGLILVPVNRTDIRTLADLKGKAVVTTMPLATGWLATLGEVAKLGDDPESFFQSVRFLNTPIPNVFSALASGHTDAAVVDTCVMERLAKEQLIDFEGFKTLNDLTDGQLACARSTALYSDASLSAFEWTDEQAVRAVLNVLLSTKSAELGEWHVHVSRSAMDELLKTLRLGPYEYLRNVSWRALLERYSYEILLGLLLIALLIANEFRLHGLVAKRTAELSEALKRQRESEKEARQARLKLGSLERRNVVNQMSAMIAHEIRTPLGAITNFASVLQYLYPDTAKTDTPSGIAMGGILKETQKIGGIVDRVRQYAKSQRSNHVPIDMAQSVHEAIRVLHMTMPEAVNVQAAVVERAPILGDSLEIELLVFNLMKNAVEAASAVKKPMVSVTLTRFEATKWRLEVSNNGVVLTDEAFEKLGRSIDSVKPEGLGMGLSIVRGIADSHGALLHFARREGGGLTVQCTFDEWSAEETHAAEALSQPDTTSNPGGQQS